MMLCSHQHPSQSKKLKWNLTTAVSGNEIFANKQKVWSTVWHVKNKDEKKSVPLHSSCAPGLHSLVAPNREYRQTLKIRNR